MTSHPRPLLAELIETLPPSDREFFARRYGLSVEGTSHYSPHTIGQLAHQYGVTIEEAQTRLTSILTFLARHETQIPDQTSSPQSETAPSQDSPGVKDESADQPAPSDSPS